MIETIWGIPIEVCESVVLELGDRIPDGGPDWRVIIVGDNDVLVEHERTRVQQRFPRELDLRGEGPGYILRPPRPRALISTPALDRLRRAVGDVRDGKKPQDSVIDDLFVQRPRDVIDDT